MERQNGVVKWFNNAKGYGFVGLSSGEDAFVHHSQIDAQGYRSLQEGQEVEFTLVQGAKGLEAQQDRA
jgi:CspA family cold shock protein